MNRILATIALIVLALSVPARAHAAIESVPAFADVVKRADISAAHAERLRAADTDEGKSPWLIGVLIGGLAIGAFTLVALPGRRNRSDESGRIGNYVKPRGGS